MTENIWVCPRCSLKVTDEAWRRMKPERTVCHARARACAEHMQTCLDRLGIPLTVVWIPDKKAKKHGEINLSSKTLLIFDENENDAWLTFEHEVYEFKFREVTSAYRTLINSLIDAVEKLVYERKEQFLEFIPKVKEAIRKEKFHGLVSGK